MLAITYVEPTLREHVWHFFWCAGYSSFLWVPLVFIAYWIGRRSIGIRLILAFTLAEAVALAVARHFYLGAQQILNSWGN